MKRIVLVATAMVFSGVIFATWRANSQKTPPSDGRSPVLQDVDDFVWMDFGGFRTPLFWLKIDEKGSALYIRYDKRSNRIVEFKSGTIPSNQREQLFRSLQTAASHENREQLDPSPIVEGDIIKIRARAKGQIRTWLAIAHPNDPLFSADWFRSLVTQLQQVPQILTEQSRGTFIRSGEITKQREASLRASGEVTFAHFTREQLDAYPNILKSLSAPEEFIAITEKEEKFLSSLLNQYGWLYASYQGNGFHITRYSFSKTQ
jgi:hypothetical protein